MVQVAKNLFNYLNYPYTFKGVLFQIIIYAILVYVRVSSVT